MVVKLQHYYTIPEVARFLGLSAMTVWRKVQCGDIQTERASTTWLISGQALKNALETTKHVPILQTKNTFTFI